MGCALPTRVFKVCRRPSCNCDVDQHHDDRVELTHLFPGQIGDGEVLVTDLFLSFRVVRLRGIISLTFLQTMRGHHSKKRQMREMNYREKHVFTYLSFQIINLLFIHLDFLDHGLILVAQRVGIPL